MTGPIRQSTGERIHDAFIESPTRDNKTAVEVSDLNSINGPLAGVVWDAFTYQYPSSNQEIVSLYEGGTSGTLKATVTLNYTDSTKKFLSSGSVVKP